MLQAAKSLEKEIEKLDVRNLSYKNVIKIRTPEALVLNNPYPISGRDISKCYGNTVIFDKASFDIPLNKKVAITGFNGSGKTTLLKMIIDRQTGITIAPKVKIGVFCQDSYTLNHHLNVFEYMQENCDSTEGEIRAILHRIGIKSADINKPLHVLSGGEIMKLTLTKLMMDQYNVLLLDEPTNFLDLESIMVVEQLLNDYEGTVVFVSHDKQFVNNVADIVYIIEDNKLKQV